MHWGQWRRRPVHPPSLSLSSSLVRPVDTFLVVAGTTRSHFLYVIAGRHCLEVMQLHVTIGAFLLAAFFFGERFHGVLILYFID